MFEFAMKLTKIVTSIRSSRDKVEQVFIVKKFVRDVSSRFMKIQKRKMWLILHFSGMKGHGVHKRESKGCGRGRKRGNRGAVKIPDKPITIHIPGRIRAR